MPAITLLAGFVAGLFAQPDSFHGLAANLANDASSQQTIDAVVKAPREALPILLRWTRNPPRGVNVLQLNLGMMAIFERLKVREAIPFLVEHVNDRRSPDPWLKDEDVIIRRSPAIRALLAIGPDAVPELRKAYGRAGSPHQDKIAMVFTLALMRDPTCRDLLAEAASHRESIESVFARNGLLRLEGKEPPSSRHRAPPRKTPR